MNVGANLMFALRTKTGIKPMFENELETFASDIGSQTTTGGIGMNLLKKWIGAFFLSNGRLRAMTSINTRNIIQRKQFIFY